MLAIDDSDPQPDSVPARNSRAARLPNIEAMAACANQTGCRPLSAVLERVTFGAVERLAVGPARSQRIGGRDSPEPSVNGKKNTSGRCSSESVNAGSYSARLSRRIATKASLANLRMNSPIKPTRKTERAGSPRRTGVTIDFPIRRELYACGICCRIPSARTWLDGDAALEPYLNRIGAYPWLVQRDLNSLPVMPS